jgi:hypothetical protein
MKEGSLAQAFANVEPDPKKVLEQLIGSQGTSSKNITMAGALGVGGKLGDMLAKAAECEALAKDKNGEAIEKALQPFARELAAFNAAGCNTSQEACESLTSSSNDIMNDVAFMKSVLNEVGTKEDDEESNYKSEKYSPSDILAMKELSKMNVAAEARSVSEVLNAGVACSTPPPSIAVSTIGTLKLTTDSSGNVTEAKEEEPSVGRTLASSDLCMSLAKGLRRTQKETVERVKKLGKAAGATEAK